MELLIDDPKRAVNDKEKLIGFVKKQHKTKIIFSVLSDGNLVGAEDVIQRRPKRTHSCRTLEAS